MNGATRNATGTRATRTCLLLLVGAAGLVSSPAMAVDIYSDDFDSGYSSWSSSGDTASSTLHCISGPCVRLKKTGTIWKTVPTTGYTGIVVDWNITAGALEDGDYCYVEVNSGSGWSVIASLTNGQDDYVYRSGSTPLGAEADDNASFQIRFRDDSNALGDYCYVDDLTIRDGSGGGGGGGRTDLSWDQLMTGPAPTAPVDNGALAEPWDADAPLHTFEGSLVLVGEATTGDWEVVRDDFNYDADAERQHLPEFDFEFVQDGRDLIPVLRGLELSTHPYWEYLVGPGRVWSESTDNGDSRASFPFAITENNANCVANGVMTFVFDDTGVSDVWYQVTQETCLYFKADMWGMLGATYNAYPLPDAAIIKADYAAEVAGRVPTADISELSTDYPGSDPTQFGNSTEVSSDHMTQYGFFIGGVHYVGGGQTRHGAYPYPESMVMPSYSTAKTTFAGIAMMRLKERYSSDVFAESIEGYVPESVSSGNWSDVTWDNALDMATGNYRFATYMRDEDSTANTNEFILEPTDAGKIDFSANNWPRKATPGTKWVYHTSDHYIATAAMQQYFQDQEGAAVDIFDDLVVADVFAPLGTSPESWVTKRTYDTAAEPWGGFGLFYTSDDIVKLANLLSNDDGVIGTTQVLDPGELYAALQKDPTDTGLEPKSGYLYNNGVWAKQYTASDIGCDLYVPFMSGYGGITVAMYPNGSIYYYVSDNAEFVWKLATVESDAISDMCSP